MIIFLEMIKIRDRLKVIPYRIGLKPLLPMRQMAYSVKIQLTYMHLVKVYIGAVCRSARGDAFLFVRISFEERIIS